MNLKNTSILFLFFILPPFGNAMAQTAGFSSSSLMLRASDVPSGVSVSASVNPNTTLSSSNGSGSVSGTAGVAVNLTTGVSQDFFDLTAGEILDFSAGVGTGAGLMPIGSIGSASGDYSTFATVHIINNSGDPASVLFGLTTFLEVQSSTSTALQYSSSSASFSVLDVNDVLLSEAVFDDDRVVESFAVPGFRNFTIDLGVGESLSFQTSVNAFSESNSVPEPSYLTVLSLSSAVLTLRRRRSYL